VKHSCAVLEKAAARASASAYSSHQRVDGALHIEFRRTRDGRTALGDLYQRAPCRVLFPTPEIGEPTLAVLLTTSGGLTGGDRTDTTLIVGPHAAATVTSQAAERIYRSLDADNEVQMRFDLTVGARAWAEYLAQETILFNGARLRRSFSARVAAEGRLLALETVVFGRSEMGEQFDTGLLHDAWQVYRDGRLVWTDALHLAGDVRRARTAPFGFGTSVAQSTLLYVGADAALRLEAVRSTLETGGGFGAASAFDGVLLVRAMAERAQELRTLMMTLVAGLRQLAGSWPARLPRIWQY